MPWPGQSSHCRRHADHPRCATSRRSANALRVIHCIRYISYSIARSRNLPRATLPGLQSTSRPVCGLQHHLLIHQDVATKFGADSTLTSFARRSSLPSSSCGLHCATVHVPFLRAAAFSTEAWSGYLTCSYRRQRHVSLGLRPARAVSTHLASCPNTLGAATIPTDEHSNVDSDDRTQTPPNNGTNFVTSIVALLTNKLRHYCTTSPTTNNVDVDNPRPPRHAQQRTHAPANQRTRARKHKHAHALHCTNEREQCVTASSQQPAASSQHQSAFGIRSGCLVWLVRQCSFADCADR